MLEDTGSSLIEIRHREATSLVDRLIEIQNDHKAKNLKSLNFAKKLKCFRLTELTANHGWHDGVKLTTPMQTLSTVMVCTKPPRDIYIAVSYPWEPSEEEDTPSVGTGYNQVVGPLSCATSS
jgi:hypothetical protein